MTKYEEIITSDGVSIMIKRTNADDTETWIPPDLANSDYQRYLRWVENPDAPTDNYLTAPGIMESIQPDEADLTEGNN